MSLFLMLLKVCFHPDPLTHFDSMSLNQQFLFYWRRPLVKHVFLFLSWLLLFPVSILCLRTSKSFLLDQLPYVQTPGWISLHFPIFHLVTSSNAHSVKYYLIFKCHNSCSPLPLLWGMIMEWDLELCLRIWYRN